MLGVWKNKKTGDLYVVYKTHIDADNSAERDKERVDYKNKYDREFSRNIEEFKEKFESVQLL
jgi:hypothetical protein